MDEQCIVQPLLLATAAAASSIPAIPNYPPLNNDEDAKDTSAPSPESSIIYRLSSIFFIGLLPVWENLEASKGFKLTVANDAASSPAGKRFTQIYFSDNKATREVLHASNFVETLLYNNIRSDQTTIKKKPIKHVIIWLARRNLTRTETVKATGDHKFVMNLSPSLMEAKDVKYEVASAIHHGIRGEHGPTVEFGTRELDQ